MLNNLIVWAIGMVIGLPILCAVLAVIVTEIEYAMTNKRRVK